MNLLIVAGLPIALLLGAAAVFFRKRRGWRKKETGRGTFLHYID